MTISTNFEGVTQTCFIVCKMEMFLVGDPVCTVYSFNIMEIVDNFQSQGQSQPN